MVIDQLKHVLRHLLAGQSGGVLQIRRPRRCRSIPAKLVKSFKRPAVLCFPNIFFIDANQTPFSWWNISLSTVLKMDFNGLHHISSYEFPGFRGTSHVLYFSAGRLGQPHLSRPGQERLVHQLVSNVRSCYMFSFGQQLGSPKLHPTEVFQDVTVTGRSFLSENAPDPRSPVTGAGRNLHVEPTVQPYGSRVWLKISMKDDWGRCPCLASEDARPKMTVAVCRQTGAMFLYAFYFGILKVLVSQNPTRRLRSLHTKFSSARRRIIILKVRRPRSPKTWRRFQVLEATLWGSSRGVKHCTQVSGPNALM